MSVIRGIDPITKKPFVIIVGTYRLNEDMTLVDMQTQESQIAFTGKLSKYRRERSVQKRELFEGFDFVSFIHDNFYLDVRGVVSSSDFKQVIKKLAPQQSGNTLFHAFIRKLVETANSLTSDHFVEAGVVRKIGGKSVRVILGFMIKEDVLDSINFKLGPSPIIKRKGYSRGLNESSPIFSKDKVEETLEKERQLKEYFESHHTPKGE
jgi:hypothetical protein